MRITFVLNRPTLHGGMKVIADYAAGLRDRGHHVTVVGEGPPRRRWRDVLKVRQVQPGGFDTTFFDLRGLQVKQAYPSSRMSRMTDADVPDGDIVIATHWRNVRAVEALSESKGAKVHLVQDYYGASRGTCDEREEEAFRIEMHRIAISSWLSDILERRFGQTDVPVVPNGIDLSRFAVATRNRNVVPRVGFMFRSEGNKGADLAIEAIRSARLSRPDLQALSFGTEQPGGALSLPEGTVYHHRPSQKNIPSLYASCDAWLFPSRAEGFGLPVLEAMACRTPVIASRAGAAPDLIHPGNGRIVAGDDVTEWAEAIEEICAMHEASWQQLSEGAYETASACSLEKAVKHFENALKNCLSATV